MVGPGIITGASDDDPSGIATYSQVGAQFGFGMLWTVILCLPLVTATQEICARLGRVTGKGLAANLKEHFSASFLACIVTLLVFANVINIAADISALGAACTLIFPGPGLFYSLSLTVVSILLQIFVPYHRYIRVLKWLTFSLLSYVGTVLIVDVPWAEVLEATFIPKISFTKDYITGLVAVLGTTISPYLFFWQASEEVEEELSHKDEHPLLDAPLEAPFQLHRIRIDTFLGMAAASIVFYCIILTVAVTLNRAGIHDIDTAAQAAEALRPLAGNGASLLFALGIIGTGLLAIPVLAGSGAYAVGEALGISVGLEKTPKEAKGFYVLIAVFTIAGLCLNIFPINPIRALFWSAVINGISAGPIMVATLLVSQKPSAVGQFVLSGTLKILGWSAALVMISSSLWLLWSIV